MLFRVKFVFETEGGRREKEGEGTEREGEEREGERFDFMLATKVFTLKTFIEL